MTKRLVILLLVLCLGFGATFALPKQTAIRRTAMPGGKIPRGQFGEMRLPSFVGKFFAGENLPAGMEEKVVLSSDTGFSKRQYSRRNYNYKPRETVGEDVPEGDQELITVSVVTAGSDMGNSIHRPERCMTAQGHNLAPSKPLVFDAKGRKLPVTKIQSVKPIKLENGSIVERRSVLYYWFVGADAVTNSHYKRTFGDLTARLLTGTDQEWAYASISIPIDPQVAYMETAESVVARSKEPEEGKEASEPAMGERLLLRKIDDTTPDANGLTEADLLAQEFIADFVAEVVDETQVKTWNR